LKTEAFTSVLNEGMMIGIKLGADTPWHGNIIYNVNSTNIRVAYIEKFMKDVVEPGCQVLIKYSNDNFFYYYSGRVTSISLDAPKYVIIGIDTAEEILNNRLFPRYDVRLNAVLKPVWDDEAYPCTVTDLSYSGAAFICSHSFDHNEQVEMLLHLPDRADVRVTGKVVRRKSSWIADNAIQFIECDAGNNSLLGDYFAQLEKEVTDIYFRYVSDIQVKK
jgi:hypothetical protein